MMKRGLSTKMISQLQWLNANNSIDDSKLGTIIKQFLKTEDMKAKHNETLAYVKMLQAFISPQIYSTVYKDELSDSNVKETAPTANMLDQVQQLLDGLNGK